MVQVSLTVGKLDASLALLLTKDHHLIEFPTLLLPQDVEAGSIITISCDKDAKLEEGDRKVFHNIQEEIISQFAFRKPSRPNLKIKNVTQTSVVLEWDPIDVATADIISLTLYKNDSRFGVIPNPLKRTGTKLSGLAIDNSYTFHLVLRTSAGSFESEKVIVKTHKMTDLSGITVCVGSLDGSEITRTDLEETAEKIGAKPLQDSVKLDTTHFVCTEPEGPQCKRAQDLNIPVVRPEWLKACESERRLVGVRAYYLNADPKLRAPTFQRSRATSQATIGSNSPGVSGGASSASRSEVIPEVVDNNNRIIPTVEVTGVEDEGKKEDKPEESVTNEVKEGSNQAEEESKEEPKVEPEVEHEAEANLEQEAKEETKLEEEKTENEPKDEVEESPKVAPDVVNSNEAASEEGGSQITEEKVSDSVSEVKETEAVDHVTESKEEEVPADPTAQSNDTEVIEEATSASVGNGEVETAEPTAEEVSDSKEAKLPVEPVVETVAEAENKSDDEVDEDGEEDAVPEAGIAEPTSASKKKKKNKKKNKKKSVLSPAQSDQLEDVEL